MVVAARMKMGWITENDLAEEEEADTEAEPAEG